VGRASGTRIAILDYGMGNLRSVEKALGRVGAVARITSDPEASRAADGIILPGVGAYPAAIRRVRELGLDALLAERLASGTPVLGICLGLQLLFEHSTEQRGANGLAVVPGRVTALDAGGLKVPHIGWEPVRWERSSELVAGLASETPFYFVHSFGVRPDDDSDVLATARWGERFTCAIARPPIYGVQFHPEKSSAAGLRLLANFAGICAAVPA
jgi:imidazole glycerol-phosphate synthase subunit HisH